MSAKKIGVLGCGMIAELGHLPALKHVAGINLHAVYVQLIFWPVLNRSQRSQVLSRQTRGQQCRRTPQSTARYTKYQSA